MQKQDQEIRNKNTDGEKVSWLKIKSLKFEKEKPNIILYKTNHASSEYKSISVPQKGRPSATSALPKIYSSEKFIGKDKKHDLEKLCEKGLIPEIYQHFYRNLKSTARVKDDEEELSEEK